MNRGRRFAVQIILLAGMLALASYDDGIFVVIVSAVLLPLPFINGTVALILIWTSRQAPEIDSLRNRADDAVTLTLASLAGAGAGLISLARMLSCLPAARPF